MRRRGVQPIRPNKTDSSEAPGDEASSRLCQRLPTAKATSDSDTRTRPHTPLLSKSIHPESAATVSVQARERVPAPADTSTDRWAAAGHGRSRSSATRDAEDWSVVRER